MAIIGAVVGAGAVYGIATSDPYSDYSDYYDYSDHSDYSDAAERRRRRLAEKKQECENKKYEINTYKSENVNEYLQSQSLINQSGVDVSISAVKDDGDSTLNSDEFRTIQNESGSLQKEVEAIDSLITKIDKVLEQRGK